ncbi:MAG: FecCD family ABC transporter permease, partial [Bacilli bacterium]
MNKHKILIMILFVLILIVCALSIGNSQLSFVDTIKILFNIDQSKYDATQILIIKQIRLPRILLAFTVGYALASAGCIVQSLLKNNLATPYTLGISSGASLAIGILIVFNISIPFLGQYTYPIIGFIAGLLSIVVVIFFASRLSYDLSGISIVLSGMVFSLFLNALFTIISTLAYEKVAQITMWQLGSFNLRGYPHLMMILPFIIGASIIAQFNTKALDIMSFSDESAKSLGINTKRVIKVLLAACALLTGASVAACGVIGFVDLVSVHLARKIVGAKHNYLIIMSGLVGGSLLIVADTIAKTIISPSEMPVGAITALIGAPFFAFIFLK